VRIRVLGSAAGGGFPQWNCACDNCRGLRAGTLRAKPRTQSSIAVSADGARWCLINASPDLSRQIASFGALAPPSGRRGTPIDAVMLTDAEIDHVAGLLSLRETAALRLYCSTPVFEWLFGRNPIFAALIESSKLTWSPVDDGGPHPIRAASGAETGLMYEALSVRGKVPAYVRPVAERTEGSTLAYRIIDARRGSSACLVPVVGDVDERLAAALASSACVFFDGSFWSDSEMALRGVGDRTAAAMGHLPIGGPVGSLAKLRGLGANRRIYTHINNTNPILDETSPERRALAEAGWEVAEDGMEVEV
jgi:pyrroloquinoline quinone biosynthesis protein B